MKAFGFALAITAAMCATAFAQEEDPRFRLQDQNSEKEPDNVSYAPVQPVRLLETQLGDNPRTNAPIYFLSSFLC
jgi:hypothetical protein